MRILIVFSSSQLGGAERSLTRMATSGVGTVSYTLSTLDGEGPWTEWVRDMGGTPVIFGRTNWLLTNRDISIFALINFVSYVRQNSFTAIYIIGLRASFWLRLLSPFYSEVRLVHGIRWNPDSRSYLDRGLRIMERLLGSLIDFYICNSKIAAETLTKRINIPRNKVAVIYNGLLSIAEKQEMQNSNSKNVIVLANLSQRKGHVEFLEVVRLIVKKIPNVHFFFVGRDDMNGDLQNQISMHDLGEYITLTGYQPDVSPWIDKCQVMVLPSKRGEGCPTSILEGFSHGLPVVAYPIDGIPELVDDGIDGFLVPLGDSIAFSQAIFTLLDNPEEAVSMGLRGRKKVEEKFLLNQCAENHQKIFEAMVNGCSKSEYKFKS